MIEKKLGCPMCGGKGYKMYKKEIDGVMQDWHRVCEACDGKGLTKSKRAFVSQKNNGIIGNAQSNIPLGYVASSDNGF